MKDYDYVINVSLLEYNDLIAVIYIITNFITEPLSLTFASAVIAIAVTVTVVAMPSQTNTIADKTEMVN